MAPNIESSTQGTLERVHHEQQEVVENKGSTARDYCALERNLLSHLRLGLLLSFLSFSLVLRARLPTPEQDDSTNNNAAVPLGSLYFVSALAALAIGWIGYEDGWKGLKFQRGFIGGLKVHEFVLASIATLIFATCLLMLITE